VVGASPTSSHPLSQGRLCIKGWLGAEFVNHPDRLKTLLIRSGEQLLKAGWDEALSLITTRFKEIKDRCGHDSLAILTSAKGDKRAEAGPAF
jgi:predicted molibdopterin-dependent oxidoreductase YjgC